MPKFLWSGRTALGREEVEEVFAETPDEARKILEARGWTDLRQHTTDIDDFIRREIRESRKPRPYDNDPVSPRERLQYRQGTAPGFWSKWFANLQRFGIYILMLVVCLALALIGKLTLAKEIWIGFLLIALAYTLFLYPALHWKYRRTKRAFVKLHHARTWHRWDEMLRCLDELAASKEATNIAIGDFSMERYRCLALAGLGRLDEALAIFRAASDKAKTPAWLAHSFEGTTYATAKQYERALECYRRSLETAVDKAIPGIDLAMFLVQRFNRVEEAKKLLAEAEAMQLSETARIHVPQLRGAIAFREKDFAAVDKNMREALAAFVDRPGKKLYIYEASILLSKGYLAVSSAALGRKDEARQFFAESGKYLKTIDLMDLVREYEVIMGNEK